MGDDIVAGDGLSDLIGVDQVADHALEVGIGWGLVENRDGMTLRRELASDMAAQEPGPAGDKHFHKEDLPGRTHETRVSRIPG